MPRWKMLTVSSQTPPCSSKGSLHACRDPGNELQHFCSTNPQQRREATSASFLC